MSTKQGRKRKSRQTARERTVLTLTEDPSTQLLVPTAITDTPNSLMSSSFPIASAATQGSSVGGPIFQPHGNFPGFPFTNVVPPFNSQQQGTPQNQPQQAPMLHNHYQDHVSSTGNADLDRLERLKKEILDGQHPLYKAAPQPDFLESIYLGHAYQRQSSVPAHPEQVPGTNKQIPVSQQQANYHTRTGRDNSAAAVENGRQNQASQHRTSVSDDIPSSQPGNNLITGANLHAPKSILQPQASIPGRIDTDGASNYVASVKSVSTVRNGLQTATPTSATPGSPSIARTSRFGDSSTEITEASKQVTQHPNIQNVQQTVEKSPVLSVEPSNARQPGPVSSVKNSAYDAKEIPRRSSDNAWNRDGPLDDRYAHRSGNLYDGRRNETSRYPDSKPADIYERGRERDRERDRYLEREREQREREREQRERERERDRERDSRLDVYRSPEEQRSDEHSRISDRRPFVQSDPRDQRPQDNSRYEPKPVEEHIDGSGRLSVVAGSDRALRPPLEDRLSRAAPSDDRQSRGPPADSHLSRVTPANERSGRASIPPPVADDRHTRPVVHDDRQPRPHRVEDRSRPSPSDDRSVRAAPSLEDRLTRPPALEERISGRTHAALEERIGGRAPPALEERIETRQAAAEDRDTTHPPPALQERIGGRAPLEDRIGSKPPLSAADDRPRPTASDFPRTPAQDDHMSRLPPPDDRSSKPVADERIRPHEARGSAQDARVTARPNDRLIRPPVDERPRNTIADNRPPAPRLAGYVSESHPAPAVQGSPRASFITSRPSSPRRSRGESRDRLDLRSAAPPYRNDIDRRYPDHRQSDVGSPDQYATGRLPYREHERVPAEERGRLSLESRQWREREPYPPPPQSAPARPRSDSYGASDIDHRYPPAPSSDPRDWPPPNDDRSVQPWLRERPLTREPERDRFIGRAPAKGVWDSSRDDRRSSAPPRSWDREETPFRASGSNTADPYATDSRPLRDLERARYPPNEFTSRDNARVRARSPSPVRRSSDSVDDLRPIKRAREEPPYYERVPPPSAEYHPRVSTPPPSSANSFYDPRAASFPSRDVREPPFTARERPGDIEFYERRAPDMPPPRSPPYHGRGVYTRNDGRDERRYGLPPPRTA